jgi:hypothetical protein
MRIIRLTRQATYPEPAYGQQGNELTLALLRKTPAPLGDIKIK